MDDSSMPNKGITVRYLFECGKIKVVAIRALEPPEPGLGRLAINKNFIVRIFGPGKKTC